MAHIERPHKISVRLSDEEDWIAHTLCRHLGSDGSSVMRQGLLDLARKEGIKLPETQKKAVPEGTARRKR